MMKNDWLIHTISLVIVSFVSLVVDSVPCYYYYTKHWSKQKHFLSYHNFNNVLKGIDINNII